jgi:hypothetical protein
MDGSTKAILILFFIIVFGVIVWFLSKKGKKPTMVSGGLDDTTFLACELVQTSGITAKDIVTLKTNPNLSPSSYNTCDDITPSVIGTMKNYIDRSEKKTYVWQRQPDPTKNTYTFTELSKSNDLYCGYFGKQKVLLTSKSKPNTITLGCECEPVEIENGTFDTTTCDYTCDEGYEKWFDTVNQQYTTTPGLRDDIPLRQQFSKKPVSEPYCVPKLGKTRPCQLALNRNIYKKGYQVYSYGNWSDKCYASDSSDCQDGYTFQAVDEMSGVCKKQPMAFCVRGTRYALDDPCNIQIAYDDFKMNAPNSKLTYEQLDTIFNKYKNDPETADKYAQTVFKSVDEAVGFNKYLSRRGWATSAPNIPSVPKAVNGTCPLQPGCTSQINASGECKYACAY